MKVIPKPADGKTGSPTDCSCSLPIEHAKHDRSTAAAICASATAEHEISSQLPPVYHRECADRLPKLIDSDPYVAQVIRASLL